MDYIIFFKIILYSNNYHTVKRDIKAFVVFLYSNTLSKYEKCVFIFLNVKYSYIFSPQSLLVAVVQKTINVVKIDDALGLVPAPQLSPL